MIKCSCSVLMVKNKALLLGIIHLSETEINQYLRLNLVLSHYVILDYNET